jgi:hypothetical protein
VDKIIYGGDTETVDGKPNSIQFYSEDTACQDIFFCDYKTAQKKFLAWCGSRKPRVNHVVYLHNLKFDLVELFCYERNRLVENGSEFRFDTNGFQVRGIYGTPTFCTVRKGNNICVQLVDSFSFFRGSLDAASKLYCPNLPKLRRPMELGTRRYTAKDGGFIDYAMRDAQVTFFIGKAIEELHREFDLQQCISIADMAARIFRHKYLSYTIPQPTDDVIHAALASYHGGKNNITVKPGWYTGVSSIDISSAYPHAMRDLPAFSNSKLYKTYKRTKRVSRLPEYGVYCISGTVDACRWPSLFNHAFKPLCGDFENVWIEVKLSSVRGYYYDAEHDNQAPALRAFCDDFYTRKNTAKDPVLRTEYKFILNSISGKFIQTRKSDLRESIDCDTGVSSTTANLVAGGMFHPFIASAITAHTRARIHRLEHHYEALHTATDGIFTQRKPRRTGDYAIVHKASKLGDLTHEAHGDLLLVRNKCYILYGDGEIESKAFQGKRICKYALHGFQSSVHTLETLIATGRRKYTVNKPNQLKQSIQRGLTPNEFVKREMTLKVGPLSVQNKR